MFIQALAGLTYLQTLRIAHRDVRSDNMLINKDGLLKLGAFSPLPLLEPFPLWKDLL